MKGLPMTNAETELAGYFAKYEPAMAKLGKALRARLQARLPGLFEIVYVYENQNALVISYSPTERGYEGVCTLSVYPNVVRLGFGKGAELSKSDPNRLLQGQGRTARYIELGSIAEFDRPEIEALLASAVKLAKLRLDPDAKGAIIIKAEEQKQRARRTTKSARPTSEDETPVKLLKSPPKPRSQTKRDLKASRGGMGTSPGKGTGSGNGSCQWLTGRLAENSRSGSVTPKFRRRQR
jgi:hypothetical protein